MAKARNKPLPASVWSQLGPVPVVMVPDLKVDGEACAGVWRPLLREIHILAGMSHKATMATIAHEWVHCILWDAGVQIDGALEESVADAMGSAIAAGDALASRRG